MEHYRRPNELSDRWCSGTNQQTDIRKTLNLVAIGSYH